MPNPESRKLIKTSVPGVYKRGNRHVAVVRIDGKQRKIACRNLAEGRDIVALARTNPKQLKKRLKATRTGVTLREYGQRWIVSYTGRSPHRVRLMNRSGSPEALAAGHCG